MDEYDHAVTKAVAEDTLVATCSLLTLFARHPAVQLEVIGIIRDANKYVAVSKPVQFTATAPGFKCDSCGEVRWKPPEEWMTLDIDIQIPLSQRVTHQIHGVTEMVILSTHRAWRDKKMNQTTGS
jgi:hypothetical protein